MSSVALFRKNSRFLLSFLLGFFCLWKLGFAQTAPEIAKKSFDSTVLLTIQDSKGQELALGSGFFVHDDIVASNLHVIKGAGGGFAKRIGKSQKFDIEGILAVDLKHDLVLLKVASGPVPSLSLGDSNSYQVGDPVYAVGNPQGLEGTFSQGIISSLRDINGSRLIQITAPISPGSSGGPVLSAKGEVIGVSVATFKGGQNLNFAIPSSYLKDLISQKGPVKPFTSDIPDKSSDSVFADLGDKNTAGVEGTAFLWNTHMLPTGAFSFSLVNKLKDPIKNVVCLLVFYQGNYGNDPIEVKECYYSETIPPGLAKRVRSHVDPSVQELNAGSYEILSQKWSSGKLEYRILNFEFASDKD